MKSRLFIGIIILLSACLDTNQVSPTMRLQREIEEIDNYLAANPPAPTDLLIKDASGIRLVIQQVGTGLLPPNLENNLKVSYVGRLFSNGNIFDSNDEFYFRLSDNVIDGWKIGLSMLTEGAEATLYIPSRFAYGPNGRTGSIPGNSILKFDIKMELVEPTSEQVAQLNSQRLAIDVKLDQEGVEGVIQHPSGVRIVHTQIGGGITPTLYDEVVIKYSGRLLSDDTEFLPLTERGPSGNFSSRLVNYLHGQIIGMQQMQAGGKATIYVPAILAFGPVAIDGVPPNTNVIYEIELLSVFQ